MPKPTSGSSLNEKIILLLEKKEMMFWHHPHSNNQHFFGFRKSKSVKIVKTLYVNSKLRFVLFLRRDGAREEASKTPTMGSETISPAP